MRNSPLKQNRVYVLASTAFQAVISVFRSIGTFFSSVFSKTPPKAIPENRFFDAVHFLFVSGPRHYWKRPTAISAGRSVGTFLHFLLEKERTFREKSSGKKGFTLIETLISITMLSVLFLAAFQALWQISFYRYKIEDRTDLGQDLYYNIERLTSLIKEGGSIDYEEYWNRRSVGTATASGHYVVQSGFGNYWTGGGLGTNNYGSGQYYCRSASGGQMGASAGCLDTASWNSMGTSQSGSMQRYGQYRLHFFDFNSNADNDPGLLGDENGDGSALGDDDDEELGTGPSAFDSGSGTRELYLTNDLGASAERTILRWTVIEDPNKPASIGACDVANATGSGCLGRIEMLRLVGSDLGMSHSGTITSSGRFDGKTDTWKCRSDFSCFGPENMPNGSGGEWVSVLSDDVNVVDIEFFPFPEKDPRYSWKETSPSVLAAPYVRLKMTVGYSWAKKRRSPVLLESDSRVSVQTTVALNP